MINVDRTTTSKALKYSFLLSQSYVDKNGDINAAYTQQAPIYIIGCNYLELINIEAEGNFNLQSEYFDGKAMFMSLSHFYGTIVMKDVSLLDITGLSDSYLSSNLTFINSNILINEKKYGAIYPLISLDLTQSLIGNIAVDGLII